MPHWRDHFNSDALGAYSLWSDEKNDFIEKDGVITHTGKTKLNLGQTGVTECFVGFTNLGKPIKLNATMSKALSAIAGTYNLDSIKNIPVTFYVDKKVKTKDGLTEAIRIKRCITAQQIDYSKEIAAIEATTTEDELKAYYLSLPAKAQNDLRTVCTNKKNALIQANEQNN